MRQAILCAALLTTAACVLAEERDIKLTFARSEAGKLPKGWKADHTGKGEGSIWKVVEDATAPSKTGVALAQQARSPDAYFNICVADIPFKDGTIETAFKAIKGKDDQGGGIVWRFKDSDNYYLCRMNPLEDNFRLYKVVAGRRKMLATTKNDVKIPAGEWHTIKITVAADQIECFLDGKKLLEAKDDTFKEAGNVGLWTKADAQTHFDNLIVRAK